MEFTLTGQQFMEALALYREGRGESLAAKAAMLAVIRNRTRDDKFRWPRNSIDVIRESHLNNVGVRVWQFSSFDPKDLNAQVWPPSSGNPGQTQAWQDCCNVVTTPLIADPTDGANCYEAMPDDKQPNWADPAKMTVQIGKTRFYRL